MLAVSRCLVRRFSARNSWSRSLLTYSRSKGPIEPALLNQTVGDHFASIVSKYGDRTSVVSRHQKTRLSYEELDQKSNALAHGLIQNGIEKGDRVAVSLGNSLEYAIATYSLFKLGAILVPLNPGFNVQQVVSALAHLQASNLVISTETCLPRRPSRSNVPLLQEIISDASSRDLQSNLIPSLRQIFTVDNSEGRIDLSSLKPTIDFNEVVSSFAHPPAYHDPTLRPDDVVNIQFTSGTTSLPKAACLSHRSILNNGKSIGDRMLLTPNDIVCCPPPLFHCFGSILGYMATATHGSSIVFPSEAFDPLATLNAVREEHCTALYGVPTMFIAELELLEAGIVPSDGFSTLRTGIAAGSSVPAELMRKLHKTLNLTELTICYGMTETSPVSLMTTTDDPLHKRIDSVGRLLPHVEAKIVSPSAPHVPLPIGQRGELAVSGYLVMQGYWDDPARTAEVMIPDPTEPGKIWMHTGDEAEMDEDGYVGVTGRIKDLIIRGGENIHPLEIENCLLANPTVREVSVVGVEDQRYGEVVATFVVPADASLLPSPPRQENHKDTPQAERQPAEIEAVKDWVRQRLSSHLVPKYVFWVERFPKTASGKIQKFKLKEDAVRLLREGIRE